MIGFSIQSMVFKNMSVLDSVKFVREAGGDAIELAFGSLSDPRDVGFSFGFSSRLVGELKPFKHISVHAFCGEQEYATEEKISRSLKKFRNIAEYIPIDGVVFHPDVIDLRLLSQEAKGLPVLLENNDKYKGVRLGTRPEDFEKWGKSFGFVLDICHLYDLDPTMSLLPSFLKVMGLKLKHLHVSGYSHRLLCGGKDKTIEYALWEMSPRNDFPIILEGILLPGEEEKAKKEIEYVRKLVS